MMWQVIIIANYVIIVTINFMSWIAFSYSLPSHLGSSRRVAVWRRLKRLGAITFNSGVYVLPNKEDCLESFQWLVQEVQEAKGDSVVMKVEKFEGLSDGEVMEEFRKACKEDYKELNERLLKLEKELNTKKFKQIKDKLRSLENQFLEIAKVDFFQSPYGKDIVNRMKKIKQKIDSTPSTAPGLPSFPIADYKNKKWVTRPRPHVDRLSSIWLIRKFINKNAKIRYADDPRPDEIPFDMKGVMLGHHQNLCTFETFLAIFNLQDSSLKIMGEIIHEIDLRDGKFFHPQIEGIAAILDGWRQSGLPNEELETHGVVLFEGLFSVLNRDTQSSFLKDTKSSTKKK